MRTNPILIGIVNAILPGLGYLILKERLVFGWSIFLAVLLFALVAFTDPSPVFDMTLIAVSATGRSLEGVAYALAILAFGYDAYDLARKKRAATPVSSSAS